LRTGDDLVFLIRAAQKISYSYDSIIHLSKNSEDALCGRPVIEVILPEEKADILLGESLKDYLDRVYFNPMVENCICKQCLKRYYYR
jgi:hypothetical protein